MGERSSIAVHNTGPAIPPEMMTTIFAPMTRGAPDAFFKARSVGLGLYIVREIARAHGGDVAVTSTPESGTTFEVGWPAG